MWNLCKGQSGTRESQTINLLYAPLLSPAGIWSPFAATVPSRVAVYAPSLHISCSSAACLSFFHGTFMGEGILQHWGVFVPIRRITSEVDVTLSSPLQFDMRYTSRAVTWVNTYSAGKTNSQVHLHSGTNIFPRFSPKSHYLQNQNNKTDWLFRNLFLSKPLLSLSF
jgi:hypothetical protein